MLNVPIINGLGDVRSNDVVMGSDPVLAIF